MTDLMAARMQMAISLGFHIIFAVVGMAMPLLMVIAEGRWLKTKDPAYLDLAKRWARGTAIIFAVGAVSGTVLSFELTLLWPRFMEVAGPVFGLPFALEGFAFFLEAIFLGIYLYGWERVPPRIHWFSGIIVCVSGVLSGVFVVTANAWMNAPQGFSLSDGKPIDIDPVAAMLNPAAFSQALHMTVAAFQAVAFGVAAIHAWVLLRKPGSAFHQKALGIVLPVAFIAAFIQPISGDLSAKMVARVQWVKLAALEGQWETEKGAPLRIGGWPDEERETTPYALEIPFMLSILAHGDPHSEIKGLKEAPPEDRPPVAVVHLAFQIMIACGVIMFATSAWGVWLWFRKRSMFDRPLFLKCLALNGPLGFLAIEAGWTVTEVGRQPWIIQGVMRTRDALTPMTGIWVTMLSFVLIYFLLAWIVVALLKRQVFESIPESEEGRAS